MKTYLCPDCGYKSFIPDVLPRQCTNLSCVSAFAGKEDWVSASISEHERLKEEFKPTTEGPVIGAPPPSFNTKAEHHSTKFPLPTEPAREGTGFVTKDSGQRLVNPSGMQRDVATDKIDYSLVFDGPMFKRWAELLDRGARKYDKRNWMKANSQAEYDRARESLVRHFIQYLDGETDEDHAAAVFFNINEMEYIKANASTADKGS